jgi:YtkA-like protein
MKRFYAILSSLIFVLAGVMAGCQGDKVDVSALKPAATRTVGKLTIVLLNKSGELTQGQNEFVVAFKDDQGQPVDVSDVQIGSSMSMPGMAPMSGDSGVTQTKQTGIYKVSSNFAMSGAWHFTLSWDGPSGQGHTTFNSNVR